MKQISFSAHWPIFQSSNTVPTTGSGLCVYQEFELVFSPTSDKRYLNDGPLFSANLDCKQAIFILCDQIIILTPGLCIQQIPLDGQGHILSRNFHVFDSANQGVNILDSDQYIFRGLAR